MKIIITISFIISSFVMKAQTQDYSYKQGKSYFIFAPSILPKFNKMDTQLAFRIVKRIYLGGEFIIDDINEFDVTYGAFTACKLPLNNHLSVWANGGYYNTHAKVYSDSYYKGYGSTSVLSVKWAIGINCVAGNGLGLTIFTREAKDVMVGITLGH